MKSLERLGALAAFSLRLFALPAVEWAGDWIVVGSLLWLVLACSDEHPRITRASAGIAAGWLFLIYALHQGPHTFWLLRTS